MKLDLTLTEEDLAGQNNESYSYSYGMVSGMQSKFLGRKDFDVFAMVLDVKEILATLEKTDYAPELEKLPDVFSDLDLEFALGKHFIRVYGDVAGSIPGEDRKMLDDIVLGETDFRNIKSILRGVQHAINPMEVKLMLRPGGLSSEFVEKLVTSKTVEEFVGNLDDGHKKGLEAALSEHRKSGSILPIEMALDRMLIEGWLSNAKFMDYVRLKIDLINILNVFRCRSAGIPVEKHLIPNGLNLSEQYLKSFEGLSAGEIAGALANTPYSTVSKSVSQGTVDLLGIEQALESLLQEEVDIKAMIKPLSIWSTVSYLNLKQKEVNKVRMVLLLKKHKYPVDKIKNISS